MNLDLLQRAAQALHLDILGGFHPTPDDGELAAFGTLILFGPLEPGFWAHFKTQKEYLDGAANPLDRWSSRVMTALATALGGQPYFPFSGPPFQPFFEWALQTGRCHTSPINLLVHDTAGLFVSFRGALALPQRINLPSPPPSPCVSCADRPCMAACPVDAFASGAYDVAACRAFLSDAPDGGCVTQGCAARRACPVSKAYGRVAEQSSYHMRMFLQNGP